jgi:predicted aspartyl protease
LEPWVPGHNRTCKFKNRLHLIAIEDNDEGETESHDNKPIETNVDKDTGPEHHISMHALSGTSSNAKTFPLFIHINNTKVLALIDSGSTTTFLDPSVMARAKLQVTNHASVKVTVANGATLWTQAVCADVTYTI